MVTLAHVLENSKESWKAQSRPHARDPYLSAPNLVLRVLRPLGQQVIAGRDSGILKKKGFFLDWVLSVTKLRTSNRRISAVKLPVPESPSWRSPADQGA